MGLRQSQGSLRRAARGSNIEKGDMITEAEVEVMHSEERGRCQKSRDADGKGLEPDSPLESLEGRKPYQHFDFSLIKLTSDF